jgi:cytochrome c-type biogenesis protein
VTDPTLLAAAVEPVRDGSLLIAIPIAILAGLVSFLSPCVLPLVPGYLGFVTGMSAEIAAGGPDDASRRVGRVVVGALGFVLGISIVFVSFGAIFGSFGQVVRDNELLLTRIFGVITIFLGLMLAGVFGEIALFNRELRVHRLPRAGLLAAPLLGITFALGWTPCIGPTLAVVLGLAASSDQASALRGATLSFAYCLGLGIPLLVAGLAFDRSMHAFGWVKRHYRAVMTVGGGSLVIIGLLQVTGLWTGFMAELQTRFGGASLPL